MKRIILLIFCFWAVSSFAQEIPNNAHKNTYGTGWECDRGYYKSGNECLQVQIPENAQLNYYGHGWECKRRFYKAGNKCLPVQIPKNAQLNYYGHGWECNKGYKKSGNTCVAMSALEIQKQKEVEQAFRIEMERRRLQGVSGDACETEYKTGAEVCVEITGVDIDCNESYTGDYYRDCDVTLNYEVQTDYKGGSYIEVEVECTVEIEYKGRQTYTTQSDTSYEDENGVKSTIDPWKIKCYILQHVAST